MKTGSVVIHVFGEEGGKKLSPIHFDITIRMEEDSRPSDVIGRPRKVYKMTWPRIAASVVHLFEECCTIAIFRLEKCLSSVDRNMAVRSLYLVIMKFNPRVPIEYLAGGHVET